MALYDQKNTEEPEDILKNVENREPFQYDVNADALYRHYRDSYIRQGRRAMEDTLGQTTALTGGYANSYAQTAAQQTYGNYLQGLNDKIPTLYSLALEQYNAQGEHERWLADFKEGKRRYEQKNADDKALAAAQLMADAGDYALLAQYYGLSEEQLQKLLQAKYAGPGRQKETDNDEYRRPNLPLPDKFQNPALNSGVSHHFRPIAFGENAFL